MPAEPRFARLFGSLWSWAGLMHLLSLGEQGSSWLGILLWAVATVSLCVGARARVFLLFCALQVAEVLIRMPWIANHWLFFAWVSGALLIAYVQASKKEGAWREPKLGPIVDLARATICAGVVALYYIALFHKLNDSFWSTQHSCALTLWESMQQGELGSQGPSEWLSRFLIVLTLVSEALIPTLLCFARTRWLGVLVGAGFHAFLAFVPHETYYNFSSLMQVLYLLFLPRSARQRLLSPLATLQNRLGERATLFWVALSTGNFAFCAYLVWACAAFPERLAWTQWGVYYFRFVGPAWCLALLYALAPKGCRGAQEKVLAFKSIPRWGWIWIFCLAINATGPYLGWKSELSFSMYSNLKVAQGQSNHWIVPASWDRTGWQSDLVEIRDSSSMGIRDLRRKNQLIPWLELQDVLARDCSISVRYTRKGKRYRKRSGDKRPPFARPMKFWKRKLVRFRPVDRGEAQSCVH